MLTNNEKAADRRDAAGKFDGTKIPVSYPGIGGTLRVSDRENLRE
jgi:hypothetical protein